MIKHILALATLFILSTAHAADPWLTLPGGNGPLAGKHVVLVSGDEEYRSEEMLPQLGKILGAHHGCKCTVLFAIDKEDGTIQPNKSNIPGLEALKTADLMIIFTRFRNLPDEQMQHIAGYVEAGKPVIGIRTATHAFKLSKESKFVRYDQGSRVEGWNGGFGKLVLGETWVQHHGAHGKQGTRGIVATGQENHPILKGIKPGEIFGPSDVYVVKLPLPGDSTPLVLGEVTETLKPDSKRIVGPKNNPMMPVAWTKSYKAPNGTTARVFTTTMGCSQDFTFVGFRRMMINASYWALGLDAKIDGTSKIDIVGKYEPTAFKAKKDAEWKPGRKPSELGD